MTISLVQKVGSAQTGVLKGTPPAWGSVPVVGNLLILAGCEVNNSGSSWTAPTGWTAFASTPFLYYTGGIEGTHGLYWKIANGTNDSPGTYGDTTGTQDYVTYIFEFASTTGWVTPTTNDVEVHSAAGNATGVTTKASGSTATLAQSDELAFALCALSVAVTALTFNGGFTLDRPTTANGKLWTAWQETAATTALATTASWTTAARAGVKIATFKAGTGPTDSGTTTQTITPSGAETKVESGTCTIAISQTGTQSLLTLLTDAGTCAFSITRTRPRIAVPAYNYPSPTTAWDAWTAGSDPVGIMIANASSGPGTTYDPVWAAAIAKARAAGVKILGYVDSDYSRPDASTGVLDDFSTGATQLLTARAGWATGVIPAFGSSLRTDAVPSYAGSTGVFGGNAWNTLFGADQEVTVTIDAADPTTAHYMYLYVRMPSPISTTDCYQVYVESSGFCYLSKNVASINGVLSAYDAISPAGGASSATGAFAAGDQVTLRANGSAIEVWHRPASTGAAYKLCSGTDVSSPGAGYIGFGMQDVNVAHIGAFGGGELRSLTKLQIDRWKTLYGVHNIFFDQATSGTPELAWYKDLSDYVHGRSIAAGPCTPWLDDFNSGASQSLRGRPGWYPSDPAGGAAFTTDSVPTKAVSATSFSNDFWDSIFSADQEIRVKVASIPSSGDSFYLYTRYDVATNNNYYAYVQQGGYCEVGINIAGSGTNLSGGTSITPIAIGDELMLRSVGTMTQLWVKPAATGVWSVVRTATDGQIAGRGRIGFNSNTTTAWAWDSFGGGAVPSEATVMLNPGINVDEGYAAFADIICTFEGTETSYATYTPSSWMANYAANRFLHLIYNAATVASMQADIDQAVTQNAGWVYVADTNVWFDVPVFLSDEVAYLRRASPTSTIGDNGTCTFAITPSAAEGLVDTGSVQIAIQPVNGGAIGQTFIGQVFIGGVPTTAVYGSETLIDLGTCTLVLSQTETDSVIGGSLSDSGTVTLAVVQTALESILDTGSSALVIASSASEQVKDAGTTLIGISQTAAETVSDAAALTLVIAQTASYVPTEAATVAFSLVQSAGETLLDAGAVVFVIAEADLERENDQGSVSFAVVNSGIETLAAAGTVTFVLAGSASETVADAATCVIVIVPQEVGSGIGLLTFGVDGTASEVLIDSGTCVIVLSQSAAEATVAKPGLVTFAITTGETTGALDDFNNGPSQLLTARAGWSGSGIWSFNAPMQTDAGPSYAYAPANLNDAAWGTSLPADQETWAVFAADPTTADQTFYARMSNLGTSPSNAYCLKRGAGGSVWQLQKIVGGSSSSISAGVTQAISAGDAVKLRCIGNVVSSWYRPSGGGWQLLESVIDSSVTAGGYVGMDSYNAAVLFDSFGGGGVATAAVETISDAGTCAIGVSQTATTIGLEAATATLVILPAALEQIQEAAWVSFNIDRVGVNLGDIFYPGDSISPDGSFGFEAIVQAGTCLVGVSQASAVEQIQDAGFTFISITPVAAGIETGLVTIVVDGSASEQIQDAGTCVFVIAETTLPTISDAGTATLVIAPSAFGAALETGTCTLVVTESALETIKAADSVVVVVSQTDSDLVADAGTCVLVIASSAVEQISDAGSSPFVIASSAIAGPTESGTVLIGISQTASEQIADASTVTMVFPETTLAIINEAGTVTFVIAASASEQLQAADTATLVFSQDFVASVLLYEAATCVIVIDATAAETVSAADSTPVIVTPSGLDSRTDASTALVGISASASERIQDDDTVTFTLSQSAIESLIFADQGELDFIISAAAAETITEAGVCSIIVSETAGVTIIEPDASAALGISQTATESLLQGSTVAFSIVQSAVETIREIAADSFTVTPTAGAGPGDSGSVTFVVSQTYQTGGSGVQFIVFSHSGVERILDFGQNVFAISQVAEWTAGDASSAGSPLTADAGRRMRARNETARLRSRQVENHWRRDRSMR